MRRGIFNWHPGISASVSLELVAVALLTGCEARNGSQTRTAAEAGRSVYGAAEPREDSGKPAGPALPEPMALEPDDGVDGSRAPVVAVKPTPTQSVAATKPEPAEIEAAPTEPALSRAQMMARIESRGSFQPAADASQYPGGVVPASPNAEPLPGGPRVLVPERKFRVEGDPPALRANYDDLDLLKVLNMDSPLPPDVVEMLPDWLKKLDGKRIRIRGFMYPQYTTRLTGFVLTRDMGACCFGPNPKIYYWITVKLKEGTEVEYIPGRPFDVVGTFHINPIHDGLGNWFQLWSMDDATVIE